MSDAVWRLVSASEQTQLLQLLEHVPESLQFSLNALCDRVMALTAGETEEEESPCSHPSTASQGDPGREVSCVARKVLSLLSPTFSAMALQFGPPYSAKQKTFPTHMGRGHKNKSIILKGRK